MAAERRTRSFRSLAAARRASRARAAPRKEGAERAGSRQQKVLWHTPPGPAAHAEARQQLRQALRPARRPRRVRAEERKPSGRLLAVQPRLQQALRRVAAL